MNLAPVETHPRMDANELEDNQHDAGHHEDDHAALAEGRVTHKLYTLSEYLLKFESSFPSETFSVLHCCLSNWESCEKFVVIS